MIPCKENKCLKYPACKNKTEISCLDLLNYFTDQRNKHKVNYNFVARHDHAWLKVTSVFPSIIIIRGKPMIDHEYKMNWSPFL